MTLSLAKWQRRLERPWPWMIGRWQQARAVAVLARHESFEAAWLLAHALSALSHAGVRAQALTALRRFTALSQIDAVCAAWAETRQPELAALILEKKWIAQDPDSVKVLTVLLTGQLTALADASASIISPLIQAAHDPDPVIAQNARCALTQLRDPAQIDAICLAWIEQRSDWLAEILQQSRYIALKPAGTRVLTALLSQQWDLLASNGPEIIPPLLSACSDVNPELAERARYALTGLKSPEAKDALCDLALARQHPLALETALKCGYAPKEPKPRALFFFLTDQWDKYESLDFDRNLLSAAYTEADSRTRSRIAEKARQSGRIEWLQVVTGPRLNRRLEQLSDDEWQTTFDVLTDSRRWAELWRFAQHAPPCWSRRFILHLAPTRWEPETDRDLFQELATFAKNCAPISANDTVPSRLGTRASLIGRFQNHSSAVSCLALTANGRTLVSGGNDAAIQLFDLAQHKPGPTLKAHQDWVSSLALSPDGQLLASASRDGTLRLWNLSDGQLQRQLNPGSPIRSLATTTDGKWLITGAEDGVIRFFQWPTGKLGPVLEGHNDLISCLAVSPNGQWLASGSYDRRVRLWSLPDGQPLADLSGHKALVNAVAFSPTEPLLVSGSKDRSLLLWTLPDGAELKRLKGHRDDVLCLAISPDGRVLASGSWDNTVRLWSLPEGNLRAVLGSTGTMDGHTGWITHVAFTTDGATAISSSVDHTTRLWRLSDHAQTQILTGHNDRVSCLALSADGQHLVTAGWDGVVCVWCSELDRLWRLPLVQTTLDDLASVEQLLENPGLVESEEAALRFLNSLMRWRRRHDIQLAEPNSVPVGEFDIEIQG